MAKPGKSARIKGHHFELAICEFLRIYGYEAQTARLVSRELDNKGVDISTDAPFNFQLKAVERTIDFHKLLKAMPTDKTPVILHKKNYLDTVVAMKLSDFADLLLFKPNDH